MNSDNKNQKAEKLGLQILEAMDSVPYEKSARGIADLIGDTKKYQRIVEALKILEDLGHVESTRKIGKTQLYVLTKYLGQVT